MNSHMNKCIELSWVRHENRRSSFEIFDSMYLGFNKGIQFNNFIRSICTAKLRKECNLLEMSVG